MDDAFVNTSFAASLWNTRFGQPRGKHSWCYHSTIPREQEEGREREREREREGRHPCRHCRQESTLLLLSYCYWYGYGYYYSTTPHTTATNTSDTTTTATYSSGLSDLFAERCCRITVWLKSKPKSKSPCCPQPARCPSRASSLMLCRVASDSHQCPDLHTCGHKGLH